MSYFLGVEADRSFEGLHLHQTKYICDLLDRSHMDGAKPLASPTVATTKLSSTEGELISDPFYLLPNHLGTSILHHHSS